MKKNLGTIGVIAIAIGALILVVRFLSPQETVVDNEKDNQTSQQEAAKDTTQKESSDLDNEPIPSKDHQEDADKEKKDDIVVVEARNIRMFNPTPDASLQSPFEVKGEARVDNNSVYIRVTNNKGKELIKETVPVHKAGGSAWGTFEWSIQYQFQSTKEGFVEVFTKDGEAENDLISIPVIFN